MGLPSFRRASVGALLGAALVLPGCGGYTFGWAFPANVRTVSVHVFGNETFRRELEFALTRAIVEEINSRSPLKIAREDEADTVLWGKIESVVENPQVKTRLDTVRESDVRITVRFFWKDRRTGELLVDNAAISHTEQFLVPLGDSVGTATSEALRQIAERVVNRMEAAGPLYATFPDRGKGAPEEAPPTTLSPVLPPLGP